MQSSESQHFYTTYMNPKMEGGKDGKLELRKFDPMLRKYVIYKQKKVKE